ncbi:MAG: OmpA family protein [Flavobacteriaceae bacterium]
MTNLKLRLITSTAVAVFAMGAPVAPSFAAEKMQFAQVTQPGQMSQEEIRRKLEEQQKKAQEQRLQNQQQREERREQVQQKQEDKREQVQQKRDQVQQDREQKRDQVQQKQEQRRDNAQGQGGITNAPERKPQRQEQQAAPEKREAPQKREAAPQNATPPQNGNAREKPQQERENARDRERMQERERAEQKQQPPSITKPQQAAPAEEKPAETPRTPQRAEREQDRQQGERPREENRPQRADRPDNGGATRNADDKNPLPPNAAPALDSAKQTETQQIQRERAADEKDRERRRDNAERPREDRPEGRRREAGPPPQSDRAAQKMQPQKIEPLRLDEQGRRVDRRPERHRDDKDAEIIATFGDRVVFRYSDGRVSVEEKRERPRWARDSRDYYVEQMQEGRYREVVVRPDGTRVVTVYNRHGDIIRRSRFTPQGREIVLVYAPDIYYGDSGRWRDPALYLPPLQLTVPVDEYILDAQQAQPRDYYRFLDKPPIEQIDRLYSVDEVRRSARLRDVMPRIDLDMVTFDFGSSSIGESQIPLLQGLAEAMLEVLDENPAETFLIEGHTDAVGSDYANLALSDARAEAVAAALTNVFGIPAENLVTQGYGEAYLKVDTEEPERENRRVAVRRITPLVTPLAQAQ